MNPKTKTKMSDQLATKPKTLKGWIQSDNFRESVSAALPEHLKSERFQRIALTAVTRTPKLAECTQESVLKCLLDLAGNGLMPDGRNAHLIPYGKECTLILDYKGLIELVLRSGDYVKIRAELVCENDEFEYSIGEVTKHNIDFKRERGEPYAVYAFVQTKDGVRDFEVLHKDHVEKVRSASKAGKSGPWKDWEHEMWKKTAIRALCKRLKLSPEINQAISLDDDQFQFSNRKTKVAEPVVDGAFIEEAITEEKTENNDR